MLNTIEKKLHYTFNNKDLLKLAFTHSSYTDGPNNEKLEFLGDSVLGLIIAEYLYDFGQDEGQMTKRKADIVCETNLAQAVDGLGVVDCLLAGAHLKANISSAIKCDLCEAIIGAIYLDGHYESAKEFVLKHINLDNKIVDYKSQIQEFIQKDGVNYIHYETTQIGGESHNPIFESHLYLKNERVSVGVGTSKRESEQKAAKEALRLLKGDES